jgi:chloramphenicol 3-O phosphotransferase
MTPDHVLKNDQLRPKVLLPLLSAFHRSLPLIASCGFPMVIDHVIERQDWLDEIANALMEFPVYLIKVSCPIEELERREKARGDRQIGFARMQFNLVHSFCDYDAEVNTFDSTLEQNVETLRQLLASGAPPFALERHRKSILPRTS